MQHSAILSTFIKQPVVIKFFVQSIFEWPLYTGFTVHVSNAVKITLFIRMDFPMHDDRISMKYLAFYGVTGKNFYILKFFCSEDRVFYI